MVEPSSLNVLGGELLAKLFYAEVQATADMSENGVDGPPWQSLADDKRQRLVIAAERTLRRLHEMGLVQHPTQAGNPALGVLPSQRP